MRRNAGQAAASLLPYGTALFARRTHDEFWISGPGTSGFRSPCPMPKLRCSRHMDAAQDHPDDQTDDPDILKENLRHLRRRLPDKERDLEAAEALVAAMCKEVERQGELRERWIEVFDMQMNEDGHWLFDCDQTELWETHTELRNEYDKLRRDWNHFVAEYNPVVA